MQEEIYGRNQTYAILLGHSVHVKWLPNFEDVLESVCPEVQVDALADAQILNFQCVSTLDSVDPIGNGVAKILDEVVHELLDLFIA